MTLRFYLLSIAFAAPVQDAYPVIARACRVPDRVVVEWWLLRPVGASESQTASN